jgi:membrane protease YdiL (CAAX protease family)
VILSWLTLKTRSPWVAALGHGAFNALAGLGILFLKPGFDAALAGSPLAWQVGSRWDYLTQVATKGS